MPSSFGRYSDPHGFPIFLTASGNGITQPAAVATLSPVVQLANPVKVNLVQPVIPVQVNSVQPIVGGPKPSRFMPVIISASSTPPPENSDETVQPVKLITSQTVVQGGKP